MLPSVRVISLFPLIRETRVSVVAEDVVLARIVFATEFTVVPFRVTPLLPPVPMLPKVRVDAVLDMEMAPKLVTALNPTLPSVGLVPLNKPMSLVPGTPPDQLPAVNQFPLAVVTFQVDVAEWTMFSQPKIERKTKMAANPKPTLPKDDLGRREAMMPESGNKAAKM